MNENQSFVVVRSTADFVRGTIERDHYLKQWPDPRALPFAYRLELWGNGCMPRMLAPDGRPWGICVFPVLQHHRQKGLFGYTGLPTCWQVLNLARVWVHPLLQEQTWLGIDRHGEVAQMRMNAFSRMVAMCLRRVQRDWIDFHPPVYPELPYHVTLIVSYCDREHHHGVGYRAANFERWGETSDGTKDVYIRRLKMPRWQWGGPQQLALFGDVKEAVNA